MYSSDELLARYRKFAIRHGEYQTRDSRKANHANEQLNEVARLMAEAGPSAYRRLLTLLDDEHIAVRVAASYDALTLDRAACLRTMREILEGPPSPYRFTVMVTLDELENGTLPLRQWDSSATTEASE